MGQIKRTLDSAIINYWKENSLDRLSSSNLTTCLFKYTFTSMGFKLSPESLNRLQEKDKQRGLEFAKKIKISSELPEKLILSLEKSFKKLAISPANKRHQRRILKSFIDYLSIYKNTVRKKPEQQQPVERQIINRKVVDRSHIQNYKKSIKSRRKRASSKKIMLSFSQLDYGDVSLEETAKELKRIEQEVKDFDLFLSNILQQREATRSINKNNILMLMGWMYKFDNTYLKDISVTSIIGVFNININVENYDSINDYYIAKGQVATLAKNNTHHTIKLLERYFNEYVPSTRSKEIFIQSIVNLCKYLYKDITDIYWTTNYEDIPIIQRLRIYVASLPKKAKVIEPELPTWDIVLNILEELRRRADTYHTEGFNKGITRKLVKKRRRSRYTIAKELQRFLILGFFTLVPPSRSRVIRELKLGGTLKHGLFLDGAFIPKDKLADNLTAKYYIHLQPEDYKTGNVYGEWLAEFPDFRFSDGKSFYDYIDRWLYLGERNIVLTEYDSTNTNDYFFIGAKNGQPLNTHNFGSKIAAIFKELTGETLYPHKFRTIFRTYLVNKGASQAELESAAFWMRHSNETAQKTYTKQSLDEKLAPGAAIAQKINSELLL